MSGILVIAKKEFADLVSSRLVILVLAFYVVIFSLSFYNYYGSIDITSLSASAYDRYNVPNILSNPAGTFTGTFIMVICYYGSLVAVVLGYSSMSGEADGKALSTLLVKPLYRDTIINGKLFGAFLFLFCIFWATLAFYMCGLFILFGGMIGNHLLEFISMLPLAFILYVLSTMLFFSLSMLACITFKEQSFALFLGFLSWILLYLMANMAFIGYIVSFFHMDQPTGYFVSGLIPYNILSFISGDIINGKGIADTLSKNFSQIAVQIFTLSLYCFVTTVMAYASFIRRDVS
jgi:ABC-2 type transport system permease protein